MSEQMHTPKRTQAPKIAREAAGRIDDIASIATTAGVALPDDFAAARTALDHTRRVADDFAAAQADAQDPSKIADDLAAGRIDLAEATQRAMAAEVCRPGGMNSTAGLLVQVVRKTDGAATRQAWAAAGAAIDGPRILDDCRDVVAQVIDQVRGLRKVLDGVTTDAQAARAGSKPAAAWADYLRAIDRWDAAHALAYILRREGWLDPLPSPVAQRAAPQMYAGKSYGRRYAEPWVLADVLDHAKRTGEPFLHLLDTRSDDAKPGGPWTIDETIDYWDRHFEHRDELERADEEQRRRSLPQPAARQAA